MKQTCILVLGMHRSGTSALTGMLSLLDVYLGSKLLGASTDNYKGHFENNFLYRVNEKILSQIESSWEDVFFNEAKIVRTIDTNELKNLLINEFKYSNLFAIKDPRLAYLFPIYERVLKDLDIDIKIIIPYRNPIEVATSLLKRNSMNMEKGILLWVYHILLAEKHARRYPHVFIDFEELMGEKSKLIKFISEKININFQEKYDNNKNEIDAFIEPGLKHHNIQFDNISSNLPIIAQKILNIRNKFNIPGIESEFDILRKEFLSYHTLFYNQDIMDSANKVEIFKKDLTQKEQVLQQTIDSKKQIEKDLLQKEQMLQRYKDKNDMVQEEFNKTKQSLKRYKDKNDMVQEEFNKTKQSLKQYKDLNTQIENNLRNKEHLLQQSEKLKIQIQNKLNHNKQELKELNDLNNQASTKLRNKEQKINQLQSDLKEIFDGDKWKFKSILIGSVGLFHLKYFKWKKVITKSKMFDVGYYLSTYPDVKSENVNPVEHYIAHGVEEGRNPNETFDSKWYLSFYKDVKDEQTNPLVHYILHGKQEGRYENEYQYLNSQIKQQKKETVKQSLSHKNDFSSLFKDYKKNINDDGMKSVSNYILASCWLSVKEPILDDVKEINLILNGLGINSLLLTNCKEIHLENKINTNLTTFYLSRENYNLEIEQETFPDWLEDIISIEAAWMNKSNKDEVLRLKCCQAYEYWHSVFYYVPPSFVLIWGSTAPLSRLLIKLVQVFDIPYLIIERGHFPGTLFIDTYGQLGFSSMNRLPFQPALDESYMDSERIKNICAWEKKITDVVYQKDNQKNNIEMLLSENKQDKKNSIFLFIGANDLGSGSAYDSSEINESHCPLFNSTKDAFGHFLSSVEYLDPNAIVIIKPHPIDRKKYNDLPSNVIRADGYNINDLISFSDVCVSLSTTAFAKCILEEVPVVTLGLSDLNLKNIAYECHSITDIPVKLRAAIERVNFEEKQKNGMKYIQYLFDSKLMGRDSSIPTNLNINNFSDFIDGYIKTYMRHRKSDFSLMESIIKRVKRIGQTNFNDRICLENIDAKNKNYTFYLSDKSFNFENKHELDVIIPVYGDLEATRRCLESVIAAREKNKYRIIVVNDKSPIIEIKEYLQKIQIQIENDIVILNNDQNLGFPGTVNKGLQYSEGNDVIVLNSDTIVSEDWAERLRKHAYVSGNIATVTPMSNNASIFSFPSAPHGNKILNIEHLPEIDNAFKKVNYGKALEVPVGHGFCIYIKRSCIDTIGYLDEQKFGRGYSEEVDYCLRARVCGMINLLATDVFIAHEGGLSFSESGNSNRIKNRKIIQEQYPEYFKEIENFISDDPLSGFRNKIIRENGLIKQYFSSL